MGGQILGEQHGCEVAHHARLLDEGEVSVGEFLRGQGVAGRVDGVVERFGAVGGGLVEERLDVRFQRCLVPKVTGMACDAVGRGGVGLLQIGNGGGDTVRVGTGDGNGGAGFE